MPHEAVRPAFAGIERREMVSLARFDTERWSGVIHLVWNIDRDSPVAIGAGRLAVRTWTEPGEEYRLGRKRYRREGETKREVLSEVVRRGPNRTPVLPGSSLKGPVRQAYELLTPSCNPISPGRCLVKQREENPSLCPACSLFGGQGYAGRVAFLEATPVVGSFRIVRRPVAKGWGKQVPVPGTHRIYGPGQAVDRDGNPQKQDQETYAVHGRFASRLRVRDASDDELGLLFAALGLPTEVGPGLRVGGRKFDGLGSVTASISRVVVRRPAAGTMESEAGQQWALGLAAAALDREPVRRQAFDLLHRALAGQRLSGEGGDDGSS